ncbi:MAG: Cytochrome b561 transmembrane protein [uncultured bacterium]|nr:MAG: Cytochrome b561 transmembrane protein [uncultured bacterium]
MLIKNTSSHFGLVSIFFHWIMAILIIALLIIGIYMTRIPISPLKLKLFRWHKELGVLVFMLVILRLMWRLSNITPTLSSLPLWERLAARSVHWVFYGFMFVLPITGWALSSAAGIPVSFFGLFILPNLVSPNEELRLLLTQIHMWLAYCLIAVLCLHIAAALKHHFINKDEILRRMLWP